ncbi:hypothetical protein ACM66B_001389 [Microbotryomycetes sp. NB124-2]
MKQSQAAIAKAQHDSEQHLIETSSTAATVSFITFVQDLRRKWRRLLKTLRGLGPGAEESAIKDDIAQAHVELALEEFLKQAKEAWTSRTRDLADCQNVRRTR